MLSLLKLKSLFSELTPFLFFLFFFCLLRVKRDFNKRQGNLALEQTKDSQEDNSQNNNLWSCQHFLLGTFPDFHRRTGRLFSVHLTDLRNCDHPPLEGGSMIQQTSLGSWETVAPLTNQPWASHLTTFSASVSSSKMRGYARWALLCLLLQPLYPKLHLFLLQMDIWM